MRSSKALTSMFALAASLLLAAPADAQILGVREAEHTTITCAFSPYPCKMAWASGRFIAPARWGNVAGDQLEFDMVIDSYVTDAKLGIRYAYWDAHYIEQVKTPGPRELLLTIDGATVLPVSVPDTGGWHHFQIVDVLLPPLQPGSHRFALSSPKDLTATNIDSFVFYKSPVPLDKNGILRSFMLIDSPDSIVLCASDLTVLQEPAEKTYAAVTGLYDMIAEDFGLVKPGRLFFHLTDKTRWWNTDAKVVQNKWGIYILSNQDTYDRTEWCWALARFLARDSGVPQWFTDSSSRAMGWMNWLPSLPDRASSVEMENAAVSMDEAQAFVASADSSCKSVEVVHLAVMNKHGQDIFPRFWKLLTQKKLETGKQSFDKHETIAILSEAAGADVLPLYKRWSGFQAEGPVDPLVITLNPTE